VNIASGTTTLLSFDSVWSSFDVPWPTPQDYNEAIQNPPYTFSDPELQTGTCEFTALGLPKPITGNFASVYRMRCKGRDWAVRCFWRELSDMQLRYRAISAHLAGAGLPYTVGFEYQPQGIKIRGNWYPILKMEWVQGQLLNDYLVSNLADPVALRSLRESWLRMVDDLERSGCAHGDLQHGNVLVVNGELRLVDYDGMFVPALAGLGSHELGQQHYQHPQRDAAEFGPKLDRFSSWVIYLSIAAVQTDPSLWTSTRAGDERLLLQRQDFEHPAASPSLALLANHSDPELQALTNKFRAAIDAPVGAVPPLSTVSRQEMTEALVGSHRPSRIPSHLRLWWRRVAPYSPPDALPREDPSPGSHPVWVVDYLPIPREATVVWSLSQVRASRLIALASLPVVGVGGIGLLALDAPLVLVVMTCIFGWVVASVLGCLVAYRRDPAVRELLPLVRRDVQALSARAKVERARRKTENQIERGVRRMNRVGQETARRKTDLQRREETELEKVRAELAKTLDTIDIRIQEVDRREAEETERTLTDLQGRFISDALRRATLRRASISGIDLAVKMRLWTLGVWAAADVSSDRIRTMQHLDHEHLMKIVAWRVGTETEARRAMPRQLPAERKQGLRRRYAGERLELVAERSQKEAAGHAVMEDVRTSFVVTRADLEDRWTQVLEEGERTRSTLEAQVTLLRARELEYAEKSDAVNREIWVRDVGFRAFMRTVWIPEL
jgi:hypothetical protein